MQKDRGELMPDNHTNVSIVRVVDTDEQGTDHTWFVGPHGSTQVEQTAIQLTSAARDAAVPAARQCHVEALFSDEDCLRVTSDRHAQGSLY